MEALHTFLGVSISIPTQYIKTNGPSYQIAFLPWQLFMTKGGQYRHGGGVADLLSYVQKRMLFKSPWDEVLPAMPTTRASPAAASISAHLVVAGGRQQINIGPDMVTVEVLNTETLQWSTASSSPDVLAEIQRVVDTSVLVIQMESCSCVHLKTSLRQTAKAVTLDLCWPCL